MRSTNRALRNRGNLCDTCTIRSPTANCRIPCRSVSIDLRWNLTSWRPFRRFVASGQTRDPVRGDRSTLPAPLRVGQPSLPDRQQRCASFLVPVEGPRGMGLGAERDASHQDRRVPALLVSQQTCLVPSRRNVLVTARHIPLNFNHVQDTTLGLAVHDVRLRSSAAFRTVV